MGSTKPGNIMFKDKKVLLADMDGTLTPHRQPIQQSMVYAIKSFLDLTDQHLAIVSGSDFDYIKEQVLDYFADNEHFEGIREKIFVLPCNGTKVYQFVEGTWNKVYEVKIDDLFNHETINSFFLEVMKLQDQFITKHKPSYVLQPPFIEYRGSLINWCLAGRKADQVVRKAFATADHEHNIRANFIDILRLKFEEIRKKETKTFTARVGGQTSIDIYPEGWDKLFSLKHFDPVKCRFIGDSCYGDGNDQPLFSYFLEKGSAWCVSSPVQTEEIIRDLILTESKFNKCP
jgi:phosphomannomutase